MPQPAPSGLAATPGSSPAVEHLAGRGRLPGLLALVGGLLLLSGAAGLVYQVAWVRLLSLTFGVTVYAVSTVLAAFMAGLALGSVLGGRLADRAGRPLRAYGLIELGIGLAALLTVALFPRLQEVYRGLSLVVDPAQAPLVAGVVRASLGFALLLVPTGLMGMTLPLAVRGVRGAADVAGDSRAMGALYALNTTGAIAGSLAAGFVLIGRLGISGTVAAAALGNLAAGLGALALARLVGAAAPAPRLHTPAAAPLAAGGERRLGVVALWAFGISGGLSLAYEIVWTRVLAVLFDSSVYGFVLMLATVLLGLALGSGVMGLVVSQRPGARFAGLAFGWIEAGIGLGAVFSLAAFGGVYDLLIGLREGGPPLAARVLRTDVRLMAMLGVATVLPAALLMGATFPVAARLWAAGASRLGARLGGVYAANVAGAIVGSLAGGFVLVPLAGAHASLLLLAVANGALGVWLLWAAGGSGAWRVGRPLLAAALSAALVLWGATLPPVHSLVFRQRFPDYQLLWYREGLENTVSVGRSATGTLRLFTNSRSQTSDDPDLVRYQRVLGHLGALLSPRAEKRALVVGLGGGATAGAIAQHSGTQVDLVELSEAVVAAAPFFRTVNRDLLDRPNVTLTIDDGRNYLLRSRVAYDLITADIVPPYDSGSTNLYSVEYFRLAARALRPDGLMVQWVSPENAFAHELIVRTFLEAFPNATLWLAGDLLIGSPSPIRVDPERLAERLADPAAREALRAVGFQKPEDVLVHFRADTEELRAYVGPGPVLSDDRPLLEYFRALDVPYATPDVSRFSSDVRKLLAP